MSKRRIIKNGFVALSGKEDFIKTDIAIEEGRIVEIGEELEGEEIINAEGLTIFPGGIDPHVHFDEPGFTQREDFFHGCSAAASGGITTVIDMPCTSLPPVTNHKNLMNKLNIVKEKAVIDFGFYGGVSGKTFKEDFPQCMEELAPDVMGFKTYFISGMETFPNVNLFEFEKILEKGRELNIPILLHAEDKSYVENSTPYFREKENSYQAYYQSRPEIAETLAIQNAAAIAKKTKAKLHIVHIGTAEAVDSFKDLENVSGETCPQYLQFDNHDLENIGSPLKVAPCIKSNKNKAELWKRLKNNEISYIASDHAPAPYEGKYTDSIWTDYSGIPGSGTLMPYIISEGYMKERLSLRRTLEVISENAAKRFGFFGQKGSIEVGKDADFAIFDLEKEWQIQGSEFLSKGKITPFEGMKLKGELIETIVRGVSVYKKNEGIQVEKGFGKFIRRDK